jgi:cytochrome c-type protein NapB
MKKTIAAAFIVVVVFGCSVMESDTGGTWQDPVPDRELGLSKTSVFEVAAPERIVWKGDLPGSNKLLPRANAEFPPRVPHDFSDHLPITVDDNVCLECHTEEDPEDKKTPRLPESHYVDYRNSPEKVSRTVAGARYVCTLCHVPQSSAPPLVGNKSSK